MFKRYLEIHPYIELMMNRPSEIVRQRGAELACVAAISSSAMESKEASEVANQLAESVITGPAEWRRGAIQVFAYNMTHSNGVTQEHAMNQVIRLMNDTDEKVRDRVQAIFLSMTGEHVDLLRDFIDEYTLAPDYGFQSDFSDFLWKYGIQEPEWSLHTIQLLVGKQTSRSVWSFAVEKIIRLVLGIYSSPIVDENTKILAMDTFDLLMSQYRSSADRVLADWDRK